jgi:hypothetical protein
VEKPDQGRVFELSTKNKESNHFLRSGENTRLKDWCFVHRGRLNVLPLRGALRGSVTPEDRSCRICREATETLIHVLNQCLAHRQLRIARHNRIQDLLIEYLPESWEITVDKSVPGTNRSLRPDIIARGGPAGRTFILDITVPFENRHQAFRAARAVKIEKYSELANQIRVQEGYKTEVRLGAIIVGALGAWDNKNDPILSNLGINPRRIPALRKKMCSAAIAYSTDIYRKHLNLRD